MATTTLMPLDPALSAQRISRVLTISADLLPDEVVAGRRARRTRGWVLAVVPLVVLALAGWYLLAGHQARLANDELETVTGQQIAMQRQQAAYAVVVNVQNTTTEITGQLSTLLATDLPWASMLDTLRTTGRRAGVSVDTISGTLASGSPPAAGTALPSTSGSATIGTLAITGTAPDKPSVAKFVDALGTLRTVANPYLTSVQQASKTQVQFSLSLDVTAEAQCGRFTTKCQRAGGN